MASTSGPSRLLIFGVVAASLVVPVVIMVAVAGRRTTVRVLDSVGPGWIGAVLFGAVVMLAVGLIGRAMVRRGYRPQLVYPLASAAGLTLCAGVFAAVDPQLGLALASAVYWIVPVTIGSSLMGAAAMSRIGTDRFCAACNYPYLDDPAAARCPECGANWRTVLGTVKGRQETNRRLMRLGIAAMALGFGLQIGGSLFPGAFLRIAPTSYLTYQAVHSSSFDTAYWTAINQRKLSPEQETNLAKGLLDARLAGERWSADDELWIDGRYRAAALAGPLADRYFAEMVGPPRLRIASASSDADTIVQVEAELRTNLRNTQDPRLIIEGWWIDGVFTPSADTGMVVSTYALEPGAAVTGSITPIRLTIPRGSGRVGVKFVGWIAVGPFPGVAWQATWSQPPGTPGATPALPGATSWLRRFEVEMAVEPK